METHPYKVGEMHSIDTQYQELYQITYVTNIKF